MALDDLYRTSLVFDNPNGDGPSIVTRHYKTTTVGTAISGVAEATEIGSELILNVVANYLSLININYTLTECNIIGITDPTVGVSLASGAVGISLVDSVALRSAVTSIGSTAILASVDFARMNRGSQSALG